ncbi:hypothetical protein [Arthrobacter sp. H20]|uniref:hypothetical protein n=1 Tax=Arthrobacter sp. H20 TaxID=1267981 RepID=UPI00047A75FE|nr:hypothetical protein [Arthrobacter sp. H20]
MNFTVTVDDLHRPAIQEVAERLRSCGLDVDRVLDAVGMITGSGPEDCRPELEAVEGVSSVDGEVRYLLPPPESDVQ